MTYTTTNSVEELEFFSETDMESVQIESSELENLESVLEENLESISVESVADDVEEYMEEVIESRGSSHPANRQLSKITAHLAKKALQKTMMNPRTRKKLEAACRKGPRTVTRLIIPSILKPLPECFKPVIAPYCAPTVTRLYPSIARKVGLKTEEIEAAPEFIGSVVRFVKKTANKVARKVAKRYLRYRDRR